MLEIEVTKDFEKQIHDLMGEYSTPFTDETFDKVLGDYMAVLENGNEGKAVYADHMVLAKATSRTNTRRCTNPVPTK